MPDHPRDHDPLPNGHPKDCNCAECELLYGTTDPQVIDRENEIRELLKAAGLRSPVEAVLFPASAWWLSFADDEGFRGAIIIHANDFVDAFARVNLLNLNPGGECQGMPIPAEGAAQIDAKWKNRLLSRAECSQFDREMMAKTASSTPRT
jgi:hypothetical protein